MNRKTTVAIATTAALAFGATSATAGSLITSAKIQDGAVHVRDLSRGLQGERTRDAKRLAALERKAGIPGPAGANGSNGAAGARGSNGAPGAAGSNGQNGTNGTNGRDGVNPATVVAKSGDGGWQLTGTPAASFAGGELRLGGGFDGSTIAGGIGATKTVDAPLSTLSALAYSAHVSKRPNDVSAPTIHVAVLGAETGTASGFLNLVFEPVNNGGLPVGTVKRFDTLAGQWWATRDVPGIARQATASLDAFKAANPNARIVAVSVDNGGTSSSPVPVGDLVAGADDLSIMLGGSLERYDFGG